MSPATQQLFMQRIAPILMAAVPRAVAPVGAEDADELVQEVMLKVWQKSGAFNAEKAAASTWIYTIARNCRTDMYRRLKKFDTSLIAEDLSSAEAHQIGVHALQRRVPDYQRFQGYVIPVFAPGDHSVHRE